VRTKTWIAVGLAAALGLGVGLGAGRARAEEPKGGAPAPEKPLKHPLTDALVGSWTTVSSGMMGGGKSKVSYALGIGGTALLQTYENTSGEPGKEETFHGHGVYKVSADGKTLSVWWFDSASAEPMKMTGPLTDGGYEIKGTHDGMPMKITFAKAGDGYEFKMFMGDAEVMKDVYTKVK
jgi:hypothetical protein